MSPTHKAAGRDFFVASKQRFHVSPVCEAVGAVPNYSDLSDAGQLLGRMAWRAARYALRISRSVVVGLSLSRRSRICVRGKAVVRKSLPLYQNGV